MNETNSAEPKKRGRKANPVTRQEIAEMLQSVIAYCQQSEIEVRFANQDGKLHLAFDGFELTDSGIAVITDNGIMPAIAEAEKWNQSPQ